MARTKDVPAHAARRDAILDSVQRLLLAKGYERLTVQDVLDDLNISKGAFYHYFSAKPAAIEALTERLVDNSEQLLAAIVADVDTNAVDKLRRFFTATLTWKSDRQRLLVAMLPVWYGPENSAFRQQVDRTVARRLEPLLTVLMRQGFDEQVFTVSYPQHAAEIVLALVQSLQHSMARHLLANASSADIADSHSAHLEAIERCVGIPSGALARVDTATVESWIHAVAEAQKTRGRT
jgi:AcrR family transcriptional regulator